jgi:hypothetical protein
MRAGDDANRAGHACQSWWRSHRMYRARVLRAVIVPLDGPRPGIKGTQAVYAADTPKPGVQTAKSVSRNWTYFPSR